MLLDWSQLNFSFRPHYFCSDFHSKWPLKGRSGDGLSKSAASMSLTEGLSVNPKPGLSNTKTLSWAFVGTGSSMRSLPKTGSTDIESGELAKYS